jgi:hypothetical protein
LLQAEVSLLVDTSADHVEAVLQQRLSPSSAVQPLGFFSKKLEPTQVKYSTFAAGCGRLLLVYAIFHSLLEGRQFKIMTDHKALTLTLVSSSEPWIARHSCHLAYIAEFTDDINTSLTKTML